MANPAIIELSSIPAEFLRGEDFTISQRLLFILLVSGMFSFHINFNGWKHLFPIQPCCFTLGINENLLGEQKLYFHVLGV